MITTFTPMTTTVGNKGLYYYGARYYDPKVSAWLSVDPLAGEFPAWTPYHYVHNNPVNLTDPTGMSAKCETCPEGEEFDLFRESEVEFKYDQQTKRVEKTNDEKLKIQDSKDPHLEALTFLKYSSQGNEGNDDKMTDYFSDVGADGYGMIKVKQNVEGVQVELDIVLDNSYPIAGGKIKNEVQRGFDKPGANGPPSRIATTLTSGDLKGADPQVVRLMSIYYPYTQKGNDTYNKGKKSRKW